MPAELQQRWVERLRRSVPGADLRFNALIGRWEFMLPSADGVHRSQFWGRFYVTKADGTRQQLPPNEVTGLHDFRDLDDAAMEEACDNLERTFIGNRYDGVKSTKDEVLRRMEFNAQHKHKKYKEAGELWADMFLDRLPRMRETQQVTVLEDISGGRRVTKPKGLVDPHGRAVSGAREPVTLLGADGKPVPKPASFFPRIPADRQAGKRKRTG